jgi:hypothetical protein
LRAMLIVPTVNVISNRPLTRSNQLLCRGFIVFTLNLNPEKNVGGKKKLK